MLYIAVLMMNVCVLQVDGVLNIAVLHVDDERLYVTC